MQSDSGARAAADSFYKNLPTDNMRCHFLKDQPAVWAYKKSLSMAIYQSKAAAHISGSHMRIDLKRLRYYQLNPIVIENRQWDPVTGASFAFAGTVIVLVKDTGDLVFKPYREYQRDRDDSLPPSATQTASSATTRPLFITNNTMYDQQTSTSSTISNQHQTGFQTTGAVACQAANVLEKFLGHYSKAFMVDLPLATTEVLRAVPRLYGGEVRDHERVRDWKSGAIVGGKGFAQHGREFE